MKDKEIRHSKSLQAVAKESRIRASSHDRGPAAMGRGPSQGWTVAASARISCNVV